MRSILLQSWSTETLYLFVGLGNGTVSCIDYKRSGNKLTLQSRRIITIAENPVVLKRISIYNGQNAIYCNSNRDILITFISEKINFERIFRTTYYEEGFKRNQSCRLLSVSDIKDGKIIYLVEQPNGQCGIQFGYIDVNEPMKLRWISIPLEHNNMFIEPIQAIFDRSSKCYAIAANARPNKVDQYYRSLLFFVRMNDNTEGDLDQIGVYDIHGGETLDKELYSCNRLKDTITHVICQLNIDEKFFIVSSCSIEKWKTLEFFSASTIEECNTIEYKVQHMQTIELGRSIGETTICLHSLSEIHSIPSHPGKLIVLFNNIIFILHFTCEEDMRLKPTVIRRIELFNYENALENNTVYDYQQYLGRTSSHYRSLFFNIMFMNVHEVEGRIMLLCNGFMSGTKILELKFSKDGCDAKEILDDIKHMSLLSSLMLSPSELLCTDMNGSITLYMMEKKGEINQKERTYELSNNFESIWQSKLENSDAFDYILDKLTHNELKTSGTTLDPKDQYLLMNDSQASKTSIDIRRPDLVLTTLDEIKNGMMNQVLAGRLGIHNGGDDDDDGKPRLIYVTSSGEVGIITL